MLDNRRQFIKKISSASALSLMFWPRRVLSFFGPALFKGTTTTTTTTSTTTTTIPSDPYFANVTTLCHFNGSNGSTTITDQKANSWTVRGTAAITTSSPVFGTGCLDVSNASGRNYIYTTSAPGNLGTGDFTVEFRIKTSENAYVVSLDKWNSSAPTGYQIYIQGGALGIWTSSDLGNGGSGLNNGAWHAVAITRSGTTIRYFIDGTIVKTVTGNSYDFTSNSILSVGGQGQVGDGTYGIHGYIDELRITVGVARYTANYTPETSAFPDA